VNVLFHALAGFGISHAASRGLDEEPPVAFTRRDLPIRRDVRRGRAATGCGQRLTLPPAAGTSGRYEAKVLFYCQGATP
jgi:hypothetical protein